MTLQYTTQMNSSGYVNVWFSLKLINLPVLTDNQNVRMCMALRELD